MLQLPNDWEVMLQEQTKMSYYTDLQNFVDNEYRQYVCYPPKDKIFEAFRLTSCVDTKVVIMGQDPYFGEGQAQGLCFSVGASQKCPPSLVNIFKAINIDLGVAPPVSGDLTYLAKQGVLLLNTTLSVRKGQPLSHAGQGWETLTNAVIALLNECQRPIVFMLWGQPSIAKAKLISAPQHLILTAPHPSPLSAYRGFFECKHFSKANDFLIKNNLAPIKWTENAR